MPLAFGFACLIGALMAALLPTRAEIISLAPVADTSLFEKDPNNNFGAQEDLPAGTLGAFSDEAHSRILLQFDLAELPAQAIIQSAALHLHITKTPGGGGEESIFGLHRMLRSWTEGTQSGASPGGAQALPGDTTWNATAYPDQLWTAPGGLAGVDFQSTPSSTERVSQSTEVQFEFGSSQLTDLADWRADSGMNFGWMLMSQSEEVGMTARRFAAREHPQESLRPRLVIEYTLPSGPPPPVISGIAHAQDGTTTITFPPEAGLQYQLQYSTRIPAPDWVAATPFVLAESAPEMSLQDVPAIVPPAPIPARFYRVEVRE